MPTKSKPSLKKRYSPSQVKAILAARRSLVRQFKLIEGELGWDRKSLKLRKAFADVAWVTSPRVIKAMTKRVR